MHDIQSQQRDRSETDRDLDKLLDQRDQEGGFTSEIKEFYQLDEEDYND